MAIYCAQLSWGLRALIMLICTPCILYEGLFMFISVFELFERHK